MLKDTQVHVRFKLAALWASVMFCYIYADYFNLYTPGKLDQMAAGDLGIGPATEGILLGVSVMMVIPSLMVFLSLALPATLCRWANLVLGVGYSAIIALTLAGAPLFYIFFGFVEIPLTLLAAWLAWSWPSS